MKHLVGLLLFMSISLSSVTLTVESLTTSYEYYTDNNGVEYLWGTLEIGITTGDNIAYVGMGVSHYNSMGIGTPYGGLVEEYDFTMSVLSGATIYGYHDMFPQEYYIPAGTTDETLMYIPILISEGNDDEFCIQYPNFVDTEGNYLEVSLDENSCISLGDMTVSGIPLAIINDGLEDIDVEIGSTFTLDATNSFDPDGTIESYYWSQSSEGTQVEFSSVNDSIVTFTIPTEENDDVVCIVWLTVTDNDGNTDMSQLTITGVEDVDCFAEDGTEGIEIWGNCYSIENTLSLELSNSGIDGAISPEIGRLINLTYLNLANNQLSGEIPSEIGNLINLNSLFLTSNQLSGDIPESMENMTNLFSLWLSDNQLSGMPSNICSWPSFINGYLLLSSNQFCPPYLECIEQNLGIQDCSQGIPPVSVINDGSIGMTATMGSQITLDGSASYDLDGTIIDYSWSQLPFVDQGIFNLTNESIVTFTVPSNIDIDTVQSDIPIGCIIQLTVTDDVGNAHMSQLVIEVTDDELGLSDATNTPEKFKLNQNYPNPFNPVTSFSYDLPKNSYVSIIIYDMLGNVINNLVKSNQSSGFKSVQWNATNNQGEPVSAGVYLYSIEAGDFRQTKKMILLK